MAEILYDAFDGLVTFLTAQLSIPVKIAYRDERKENADDIVYPSGTLMLFDTRADNARRTGLGQYVEKNIPENEATIKKAPIPVRFYFQLDLYAEDKSTDWKLDSDMMAIVNERYTKFITNDSKTYYIYPFTNDTVDSYTDGTFRKNYRFYIEVNLESKITDNVVPLIKKLILNMQNNNWEMQNVS